MTADELNTAIQENKPVLKKKRTYKKNAQDLDATPANGGNKGSVKKAAKVGANTGAKSGANDDVKNGAKSNTNDDVKGNTNVDAMNDTKDDVMGGQNEEAKSDTKDNVPHKKVPEHFLRDLNALSEIIDANPSVIDPIREVFEYHLVDPIDRKTFPKIVNALSMLLGPSAAMVVVTGCHVNSVAFFDDLLYACRDNEKVKPTIWIMQLLTSLYGNRVQNAYSMSSGTLDEDWHTIDVNTYRREGENPVWLTDVVISLYTGSESHLRMTPDSLYQLVDILVTELSNNIPHDQIDEVLVDKCKDNLHNFMAKFYNKGKSSADEDDADPVGYA